MMATVCLSRRRAIRLGNKMSSSIYQYRCGICSIFPYRAYKSSSGLRVNLNAVNGADKFCPRAKMSI